MNQILVKNKAFAMMTPSETQLAQDLAADMSFKKYSTLTSNEMNQQLHQDQPDPITLQIENMNSEVKLSRKKREQLESSLKEGQELLQKVIRENREDPKLIAANQPPLFFESTNMPYEFDEGDNSKGVTFQRSLLKSNNNDTHRQQVSNTDLMTNRTYAMNSTGSFVTDSNQ